MPPANSNSKNNLINQVIKFAFYLNLSKNVFRRIAAAKNSPDETIQNLLEENSTSLLALLPTAIMKETTTRFLKSVTTRVVKYQREVKLLDEDINLNWENQKQIQAKKNNFESEHAEENPNTEKKPINQPCRVSPD